MWWLTMGAVSVLAKRCEAKANAIYSGCFYFMECEAESQDFLFSMGSRIRSAELLQFR